MKDNPTYEKLLKIRQSEDIKLKPSKFLRDTIISNGEEVPLQLRTYQIQMVYHMLMMKNFICGDDTGLGKCKTHASLVQTDRGLVELGKMHDWSGMKPETFEPIDRDWKVLVDDEALPVKNFYYGGVKPTIKVQTRYGLETEASRVHPLLVWRDGEHQWVETQDLREGDYLCVERREMGFPAGEPELDTDVTTRGTSETYPVPSTMSPDFARFLGYYIGEGALTAKNAAMLSQCPQKNPEIHEDILDLAARIFHYEVGRQDIPDIRIYSTYIRQYLYQNGLGYVTSHERKVPDCILRSTRESNRQFLRGIFEAEGHVLSTGGIEFSTASEELGCQLQIMLLRFGIVANRSPKTVKGYEHNDYWRLTVFGQDARIFRDKIGLVSQRKQEALTDVLNRPTNANHDVVPNAKPLIEDLRALLKEALTVSGSNSSRRGSGFKQYGISFVNTLNHIRNAKRNPTYGFINLLLEIAAENGLDRSAPYLRLQEVRDKHYFYDPIVSLESGEAEVFDIEVDDPRHCFVANGLVNHNTLECIATLCYLWEKEPDLRPIIVTTTSAMKQWGGEIDKFTHNVDWVIAEGGPDGRKEVYEDYFGSWDEDNPRALIINYPRLRRDKRDFLKHMEGHRCVLVLDEATAVKSTKSKTHHTCKRIAENCERVYGLTATLIKNNLVEGYGIFKVVNPDVFKTKTAFLNNYCVTRFQPIGGGRKVKVVVGHSKDHISLFKNKIDPYYLGRAKHDVAKELPLLTTKEVRVAMSSTQWDYYNEALSGLLTVNMGTDDEEEKETTKLTQLIYCQQIANDPYLIGNEGEARKVDMLMDMLDEDLDGEKVIVFTRFRQMVDRFQHLLEDKGYVYAVEKNDTGEYVPNRDIEEKGFARVTGQEDGNERDAGRIAFTEEDGTNLIFLTMAGAEAMNLQQARIMVFFDLPWSAGDYLQLVGRMIRIGSPHQSVYSIHLLSEGPWGEQTIDHHVTGTLNKKMGFIEGALGERILGNEDAGEEIFNFSSDTEDIFASLLQNARDIHDGE